MRKALEGEGVGQSCQIGSGTMNEPNTSNLCGERRAAQEMHGSPLLIELPKVVDLCSYSSECRCNTFIGAR